MLAFLIVFQTVAGVFLPVEISLEPPYVKIQETMAAGWLPGWLYRKPIVLTGGASGAQTAFQLAIATSHVTGKMLSDFDDIRFTQADGTTLIDAWLEDKVDDTSADTWVEFPTTPANTVEQTYYMYYGKGDAADYWDGGATFEFFDDFEDGDVSDWAVQTGSGAITPDSVIKYAGSYSGKYTHDAGIGEKGVEKTVSLAACVLEYNVRPNTNTGDVYPPTLWDGVQANYKGTYFYFANNGQIRYYDTGFHNVQAYSAATWYKIKLVLKTLTSYDIYIDDMDTPVLINVATRGIPTAFTKIWIGGYSANGIINVDNIFIRKYAANPPTYEFGAEEEPNTIPIASSVSIDSGAASITLNEGTTKSVVCTATVLEILIPWKRNYTSLVWELGRLTIIMIIIL